MTYDIIIVGAGPSGSIAAYESAKAGLKTLLLEKAALPRDKPCGGAVMYRGLLLIKRDLPHHLIERKIFGLSFEFPSGKTAEFVSDRLIGITVHRALFDEFLARRAEGAGAELLESARVTEVNYTPDGMNLVLQDGRTFSGQILIGADGVNTTTGRALKLRPERKDLTKVGLGMEADFHVGADGVITAMNGKPGVLRMLPVKGRLSYGWIFPKREHLAIGIAGGSLHMHPLRPMFESFRKQLESRLGLPLVPERVRTHFLGGWGLYNKNVADRVMLVGDAAGWVDPMMGEGIAYAMMSGRFAAEVASQAIEKERFDEEFLTRYHKLCADQCAGSFGTAAWAGSRGLGFAETLLSKASGHPLASEIMAMVARGEIGYSDIPAYLVRKLPHELPSLIRNALLSKLSIEPEGS